MKRGISVDQFLVCRPDQKQRTVEHEIGRVLAQILERFDFEACATGGRALASKDLMERLDGDDAAALAVDPDHITYTALADLGTATDKA